jgi:hypothetical protein
MDSYPDPQHYRELQNNIENEEENFLLYCTKLPTVPSFCFNQLALQKLELFKPVLRIRSEKLNPYPHQCQKAGSGSGSAAESKFMSLWRLKMESRRAIDAHDEGVEVQKRFVEGL